MKNNNELSAEIQNDNLDKPMLGNRLFEFRGISKDKNEVIFGNYYFDGKCHFIDKCFEHRKEVYVKSVSQFTGLISIKKEKAFFGDVISFQTTEGNEMTKELWFCNDKQSLMVGNFTYYELTQSAFIQPTKLEFDILQQNKESLNQSESGNKIKTDVNEQNDQPCDGNCGMNYCDTNGCIDRKRILTDPKPLED